MDQFEVKYESRRYEISNFLRNHPGGVNYVETYKDKDITNRMKQVNHSKSAFYLLKEYNINGRDDSKGEICEDLEHLVDWNKPMLSQVANLGSKYSEWVVSPVDRKLILFGNPILESLTKTPWYIVPIVWLPFIAYCIYKGYNDFVKFRSKDSTNMFIAAAFIIIGIIIWTLVEYCLHRWIFHMNPTGKSRIKIYIHFAIHGLHHKVPFDNGRLVFPPAPAAVLAFIGHHIYATILPTHILYLVIGGTILGYVIYDMIHFYLHHGSPAEGTYLYDMKRYHNQHHFTYHNAGFGISSSGWDSLFGTIIKMKDLKLGIKWR